MDNHKTFSSILAPYQKRIDALLQESIHSLGGQTSLRDACEYALTNGGKRFRPALVWMIAEALGYGVDVSQAALSIEFFHTASLIADDLPCMDNDDERRQKPTLHRVYDESTALLTTYALIAAGYASLVRASHAVKNSAHPLAAQSDHLCVLALENATHNTGILGATGGQFLDLAPLDPSLSTLREVMDKKTVTLFEIAFVYGWIFGGGSLAALSIVKKSAAHFGMAFQIADDLDDMTQDFSHNHVMNIANIYGKDNAIQMFHEEVKQFRGTLKDLHFDFENLEALINVLERQVNVA